MFVLQEEFDGCLEQDGVPGPWRLVSAADLLSLEALPEPNRTLVVTHRFPGSRSQVSASISTGSKEHVWNRFLCFTLSSS